MNAAGPDRYFSPEDLAAMGSAASSAMSALADLGIEIAPEKVGRLIYFIAELGDDGSETWADITVSAILFDRASAFVAPQPYIPSLYR